MYPLDWWSSETFFNVDDEVLRYRFLEMMFLVWNEGGFWRENKAHFDKRFRKVLTPEEWAQLAELYNVETFADGNTYWHHDGISKRLNIIPSRVVSSRANGNLGGRPDKTQDITYNKPRNNLDRPPLKETKGNITEKNETKPNVNEGLVSSSNGVHQGNTPRPPTPPLWGSSLRQGSMPMGIEISRYKKSLEARVKSKDIEIEKRETAFRFCLPNEIPDGSEFDKRLKSFFKNASDRMTEMSLECLVGWLEFAQDRLKTGTLTEIVAAEFDERMQEFFKRLKS